ncbi:hypothetical protein [Roseitranquillus sediminis]|uniref:hypothetical protein n=1 Tax=Roseitranquillus sediminis TaxID=2809051 RepID=UPI001D0C2D07|nr:hypothetical protein [Roseitranquillus sediminis]MBM9593439.1 hypothetical protein [Roseitranquillus sediminis]
MTETEADTRANRIDPIQREAGWGVVEGSKIRREMICPCGLRGATEEKELGRLHTGSR